MVKEESIKNNPIFLINFWITIFAFTLLRFTTVFSGRENFLFQDLGVFLLFADILMNILFLHHNKVKLSLKPINFLIILILVIIWIIAIIRSTISSQLEINFLNLGILVELSVFFVFGFISLIVNQFAIPQYDLSKAIIYSVLVLVATNLFLYTININPKDTIYLAKYPAQLLSIFGFQASRVLFPLATGINNYGVFIGIGLISSVILWVSQKKGKTWIILSLSVAICLISLIMVDSRGPIIFSLVTLFIIFLPKRYFLIVRWVPFLVSLLPIYLFLIPQDLVQASFSFMNRESIDFQSPLEISESQKCDIFNQNLTGVLSNRPVIWNAGFSDLANFNTNHIWGYGFRGQIISGISSKYSCLFLSHVRNNVAGLHNIWLQQVFDTGYIGAIILMICIISSVITFSTDRDHHNTSRTLLGILLYCLLVGSMEAIFTPDYIYVYLILIYIFLIKIFTSQKDVYANIY